MTAGNVCKGSPFTEPEFTLITFWEVGLIITRLKLSAAWSLKHSLKNGEPCIQKRKHDRNYEIRNKLKNAIMDLLRNSFQPCFH